MRCTTFALACAIASLAAPAVAQVHEPNGLLVPINSAPEIQLSALFAGRGEAINSTTDAHTTPSLFSPLCGFTATFVLNQAGSHFGLAWYNATGSRPAASGLHVLVPAGSAVGTSFTGTSIRMDPAYAGGLIGFALVGGETHYSESQWDTVCTSCTPPAPWITALMYASTRTPNAYYVCFEDGNTSATGWNNDGDFNDDVFFVTGVTCSGGGATCNTGMMGVCAAGVQQCSAGGALMCVPVVTASPEVCNGVDDDCDGMVDEGSGLCTMSGFVCDRGVCVHPCDAGEFRCLGALVCDAHGFCVDPACATTVCPTGQVCRGGTCRGPCDGVTCPHATVCRVDRCVDPCSGVTCAGGQVCDAGVCRDPCSCVPCASGLTCATSGVCVDPACATTTCGAGMYCMAGTCVDGCAGVVCPPAQMCTSGACVPDPCATMTCTTGLVCRAGMCIDPCMGVTCGVGQTCVAGTCANDPCAGVMCPATAHCVGGTCVMNGTDGGTRDSGVRGDANARSDGGGGHPPMISGGCCSVAGGGPIGRSATLLLLAIGAISIARRRRR